MLGHVLAWIAAVAAILLVLAVVAFLMECGMWAQC
jgi:hypothetical protein